MPTLSLAELATYWFIGINFIAFAAFGWDKAQAERGGWRVSEARLVQFVILGGLIGALAGRALFRHKTRKRSFSAKLWSGALGSLLLIGAGWYFLAQAGGG